MSVVWVIIPISHVSQVKRRKRSERIQPNEKYRFPIRARYSCVTLLSRHMHKWTCQGTPRFASRDKVEIHYHIIVNSTLWMSVQWCSAVRFMGQSGSRYLMMHPVCFMICLFVGCRLEYIKVWHIIFCCLYISLDGTIFCLCCKYNVREFSQFVTNNFTNNN